MSGILTFTQGNGVPSEREGRGCCEMGSVVGPMSSKYRFNEHLCEVAGGVNCRSYVGNSSSAVTSWRLLTRVFSGSDH